MFRSPLFSWSPRPGQDRTQDPFGTPVSQTPSRFGALHSNLRGMVNGSSVYSQSPAPSNNNTPKVPFLGFFRRDQSPDPNALPISHDAPRYSDDSRSPLRAHHTAGSYIDTIAPQQGPETPQVLYNRHPADVPLPQPDRNSMDPEVEQPANEVNGRRHRRRHRRRKHRHQPRAEHWVRRRGETDAQGPMLFVRGSPARGKMIACVISGIFLLTVLAIYLAIALTNHDIGQEIHILFIMILLTITIFFCHSLIRLCMLILNPRTEQARPFHPELMGTDGFQPIVPIRVHLARDEEAALENEVEGRSDSPDPEKDIIPPPPPAYGLWRSSVRVDPNLLHWQRVGDQDQSRENRASVFSSLSYSQSRNGSVSGPLAPPAATTQGPRPPSYVSEDGVSYIVEAEPRSTVRQSHSGISDIHPAWRPGYAISEVTVWPGGRR
ncbi:hypothetical protein GQ44DRAFT_621067 [Phaeosphaeriaceae sp. PMI808]|nr:hypothetical protein GQ44DRAFT_621067 [Phaeosphaeriaceae sp. PMI808]